MGAVAGRAPAGAGWAWARHAPGQLLPGRAGKDSGPCGMAWRPRAGAVGRGGRRRRWGGGSRRAGHGPPRAQ
eukprot:13739341-Alexandrium_andersonii.AAC.1